MGSDPLERQDGSFVVRIWWEPGGGRVLSHWRGWIQHVRSGSRTYFANLRDLNDFIERETGIEQPHDEQSRGLV